MKEGGEGGGKRVVRTEKSKGGGKERGAREGLCYAFMRGSCHWGSRCRFVHDPELRGDNVSDAVMGDDVRLVHNICYTSSDDQSPLEILYTSKLESVEEWVRLQSEAEWFGVDTESRPCFTSGTPPEPPSVLQLSTCRSAVVFQLNACKSEDLTSCASLAPSLFALLFPSATDMRPLVGMSLLKDLMELEEMFGWRLVDDPLVGANKDEAKVLRRARHPHLCDMWMWQRGGLLELAQGTTDCTKWKSNALQLTRWDVFPLQTKSLVYAAMDAWAGAAVYQHFKLNPPFPEPPPALPKKPKKPRKSKNPSRIAEVDQEVDQEPPATCRKFLRGKCSFGDACKFLHVASAT